MRRVVPVMLAFVVVACSSGAEPSTTTAPVATTMSTTAVTTTAAAVDCRSIPYEVGELPNRVVDDRPDPDDVPQDEFTTVPGTVSRLWLDEDGNLAVVFVRGALPPVAWPGDRGEVSIDGARGVAGQLEDGSWMVAWLEEEGGEPCDRYFMVFYAPVEASEVEAAVASLNRTAD